MKRIIMEISFSLQLFLASNYYLLKKKDEKKKKKLEKITKKISV